MGQMREKVVNSFWIKYLTIWWNFLLVQLLLFVRIETDGIVAGWAWDMSNGFNNSEENKVRLNTKSQNDMNWHIFWSMHEINLMVVSFFSQFFFSVKYRVRHPDGSQYTYLALRLNKFTCRCFVSLFFLAHFNFFSKIEPVWLRSFLYFLFLHLFLIVALVVHYTHS